MDANFLDTLFGILSPRHGRKTRSLSREIEREVFVGDADVFILIVLYGGGRAQLA